MSERKYYCFCDSNCKFETMTKEQILAAIQQAAESGLVFDPDAAFITKVKEQNAGNLLAFWVGTQAQYNALQTIDKNCHYIITDKTDDNALTYEEEVVTLAAGSWYNKKQTVNVNGATKDNLVIPSPSPEAANRAAYAESGVCCIAQEDGRLTFECDDVPSVALAVNVVTFTKGGKT